MTETTTTQQQPNLLLNLIIAFLAPMFLGVSGGNIDFARAAAIETVNAYRAQTQSDLIAVAQIIAFGLAALGSLSLSMADDLSLPMILRLRASANACNRSAELIRRALKPSPVQPIPHPSLELDEAKVIAGVAAAQKSTAEARPHVPPPAAPTTPAPAQTMSDQQYQALWAAAAADVAAEFAAELPNLPPKERQTAKLKAALLSSCANDLLTGPPLQRLRPGDLAGFMQSGTP